MSAENSQEKQSKLPEKNKKIYTNSNLNLFEQFWHSQVSRVANNTANSKLKPNNHPVAGMEHGIRIRNTFIVSEAVLLPPYLT